VNQLMDTIRELNPTAAGLTADTTSPSKRIDYIFTRSADGIRARRGWIPETLASDHVPVVAELEIRF